MPSYFLYARKSEETEDRQILSIDSQLKELTDFARANNFPIKQTFREAHSAKAPGRPIFAQIVTRLARGEVTGLLCWKLDRLARNPVDGGALIWAMDQGQLQEIVTPGRTFMNTGSDKFWMQLEFGMAKKYVDDLSDNIRRGNRAKLEQGWLPGVPPLGYLNDRVNRTIIPDPDRFHLIRQIWKRILAGEPPARVLERANNVWGVRTRVFKTKGGAPLHPSLFYDLLSNHFYYGLIMRGGQTYRGAHQPMISSQEFHEVQRLLGRPNHTKSRRLDFAYTGLIRCGECGASVTGEVRINRQGHRYIYYHCTFRKMNVRCSQRRYVRLEALEKQIVAFLSRFHLPKKYVPWITKHFDSAKSDAAEAGRQVRASLAAAYNRCKGKLSELTDLRLNRLLSDEEFEEKRKSLLTEEVRLKRQKEEVDANPDFWFEPAEMIVSLANRALKCFQEGDLAIRRALFATVCSNPTLKDGILRMEAKKPFLLLENGLASSDWCSTLDDLRTWLLETDEYFAIPDELLPDELLIKYQNQPKGQGRRTIQK